MEVKQREYKLALVYYFVGICFFCTILFCGAKKNKPSCDHRGNYPFETIKYEGDSLVTYKTCSICRGKYNIEKFKK